MVKPNAPTNLVTSADERYTITLTWVAPASGDTPTFYSIYYGTEESTVDVLLGTVAHPTVTYDHTPVDDGAIFYYEVFANNGDGQSATGATNSGASWDVPGPPLNITVTATDVGELSLVWDEPAGDGGTEIINYKVYTGTSAAEVEAKMTPTGTLDPAARDYILSGLDDGLTLYYQVTAENLIGESPRLTTVNATTWDIPGPPLNISVTATDVGELTLVWDEPAADGGTEIINYKVYTGTSLAEVEAETTPTGTLNPSQTDYILTGLDDGYTLYYQVTAENLIGESLRMTTVNATTWDVPDAPTNMSASGGDGELTVEWVAPLFDGGTEVTNYKIYTGTSLAEVEAEVNPTGTITADNLYYTITALDDSYTLYFQVEAVNAIGDGARSVVVSAKTDGVPDAPISVATVDGNTVVTVSWDAPVDIGGTEITEYHVYRGVALGALVEIGTTAADRTWFASTGLTNNTTYYFAVSAENVKGEGAQSLAVSAKPEAVISTEENLLQWVCDSVGMSVFKAYGVASFVAPISDKKKILGIYASFITTDNVTAETNIVVNVDAHTVLVYEGGVRSSNLYDLLVMVLYR